MFSKLERLILIFLKHYKKYIEIYKSIEYYTIFYILLHKVKVL